MYGNKFPAQAYGENFNLIKRPSDFATRTVPYTVAECQQACDTLNGCKCFSHRAPTPGGGATPPNLDWSEYHGSGTHVYTGLLYRPNSDNIPASCVLMLGGGTYVAEDTPNIIGWKEGTYATGKDVFRRLCSR
jgi:hypothetical protein